MQKRPVYTRRGEQAIHAEQEAGQLDSMVRLNHGDEVVDAEDAKRARAKRDILGEPTTPVVVSCGEAVSWENKADEPYLGAHALMVDTLEHADSVSSGASDRRVSAASPRASSNQRLTRPCLPKLATQSRKCSAIKMAGAHFGAMRLIELSLNPNLQTGEVARFTNAALG